MLIRQKIQDILNGVSQKAAAVRPSSQHELLENMLSHRVFGLRRRPGTIHVAKLFDLADTGGDGSPPTGLSLGFIDSFSYAAPNAVYLDERTSDGGIQTQPPAYGYLAGPSGSLYDLSDPTMPVVNRNGDPYAYVFQRILSAGVIGRGLDLTGYGVVDEICWSCVVNLRGRTFVSPLTIAAVYSATTGHPVPFTGTEPIELRVDIRPDRKVEFRVNHTTPATFTSTATVPADGFCKLDFRLKAHPTAGTFKCQMFDAAGTTVTPMIDRTGLSTTVNGAIRPYPIARFNMTALPNDANTTTDGIVFHDLVITGNAGLANGELRGDVRCGNMIPNAQGSVTESVSSGGFLSTPGPINRWKNLIVDEANAYNVFDTSGQKDSFSVGNVNVGAAQILTVEPYYVASRVGSAVIPNTVRMFVKSGATTVYSPAFPLVGVEYFDTITQQGSRYGTGVTQQMTLPRWVLDKNPATNTAWTPDSLAAIELGIEATHIEDTTNTYVFMLGLEYTYKKA